MKPRFRYLARIREAVQNAKAEEPIPFDSEWFYSGSHMTVDDFIHDVKAGMFTDYDGWGYLATDTHYVNNWELRVIPSEVINGDFNPFQFTHIYWANR